MFVEFKAKEDGKRVAVNVSEIYIVEDEQDCTAMYFYDIDEMYRMDVSESFEEVLKKISG